MNYFSSAVFLTTTLATTPLFATTSATSSRPYVARDTASVTRWDQTYVVGNGRLGASAFGQFPNETIVINDETVWERKPDIPVHKNAHEILEQAH